MKISWNWLNDYIDISDYRKTPEELGKILTAAGLEIEGIDDAAQKFQHVVIGKLITVGKHPDADKLTLCSVDVGEGSPRQIVCGAKNHKAGDYVVAALPGAVLPGDFAIKKSKIRGVESLGMLCSTKELGLGQEGDGILIFKEGKPGQPFAEKQGLDDIILEINVTPNRADCLSHLGLAMELSALLRREFKKPKAAITRGSFESSVVQVAVTDSERCPRYAGCVVKNVKVGPSPEWLKQRLESVGLRSINNIVDVTNYVMLEYGQPMHAFDLQQIKGQKISVRSSQKGESFITLDGTELTLSGDELVIADQDRVVALAGVVGGKNSGVTDATQNVFLESAYFNSQTVRRTSRRFGFETDSSYRFSRGVNPNLTVEALDRACELLQKVAQGEVAKSHLDVYPRPIVRQPIAIDVAYVAQRLGYAISQSEFEAEMKRLGCEVSGQQVTPPSQRGDITIPEDLVEEYARLNGYDRLVEKLPVLSSEPTLHATDYTLSMQVAEKLAGFGASQAVNYAFVNKALQEKVLTPLSAFQKYGFKASEPIAIKNPITEDFAVMRSSLLPSLLNNLSHNVRHGNLQGQIFEIGQAFNMAGGAYAEEKRLALVAWGQDAGVWGKNQHPVYRLKSIIDNLLEVFLGKSGKWEWVTTTQSIGLLHPNQLVQLMWRGKSVGVLGSLHPQVAKDHKLRSAAAFAEMNFDDIFKIKKAVRFVPIAAFPSVEKDLTFVMPKSMKAHQVIKEILRAGGNLLSSSSVVDLFEGDALGSDKKALTFRMVFQSAERTLSDDEVLKLVTEIINSVSQKLSLQLR